MGDPLKDSRFAHIANDPRYKSIPRSQRRVKIDKRFQSMFKDKRFKIKYTVDKRGRPISKTSNEDLERYYALSSGSSDSENDESDKDKANLSKSKKSIAKDSFESSQPKRVKEPESTDDEEESASESSAESNKSVADDSARSDDEVLSDKVKSKLHDLSVDYARGESALMSDSSSDEESSEEEADDNVEHGWGELDKDAERTDEATSRLAVCNMDWDRIRAVDLMVLLNSFAPPGGLVRRVTIYPSDFGLERMKKEEVEGPTELVQCIGTSNSRKNSDVSHGNEDNKEPHNGLAEDSDGNSEDEDESDQEEGDHKNVDDDERIGAGSNQSGDRIQEEENEEGSSYHMEKLRQYQLNRLKYFYAIVECDSVNTANHIYSECDGREYESSATRLDLRFVPDDTTFDQEPRETCTEMPDAAKYKPRYFTNTALQQVKVDLTWDETDPTRMEITERLMKGDSVDDTDLQVYLASSSGGEESSDEDHMDPYPGEKSIKRKEKSSYGTKSQKINDEPESDEEDPISKYRNLLNNLEEEQRQKKAEKDIHMEISWGLGLEEKAESVMKKRTQGSTELTPFESMLEKRKQKRIEKKKKKLEGKKSEDAEEGENMISDDEIPSDVDLNDPYFAEELKNVKKNTKKEKIRKHEVNETEEDRKKKAELELLLLDKDEAKHFNFKKIQEDESAIKSKRKKKAVRKKGRDISNNTADKDNFEVNVDDKRFSALYSSHLFNIDPTDPHFRKSDGMNALISAKQKRITDRSEKKSNGFTEVSDEVTPSPSKRSKKDVELALLVKSVKNKASKMKKL